MEVQQRGDRIGRPPAETAFGGDAEIGSVFLRGRDPSFGAPEAVPINELERDHDPQGDWRRSINDGLETTYRDLVNRFDQLLYIKVPHMIAVRRWRLAQEQSLPATMRKGVAEIDRFVALYERLTLWMMEDLPARADLVVHLGENHEVTSVVFC